MMIMTMAMIVQFAPTEQQGKALGAWNSIGPVAAILGPPVAGAMIDTLGWRSMLGAAIGGVVLYGTIEAHGISAAGYRPAFLFYLVVSVVGAASALGLSSKMPTPAE